MKTWWIYYFKAPTIFEIFNDFYWFIIVVAIDVYIHESMYVRVCLSVQYIYIYVLIVCFVYIMMCYNFICAYLFI